MSAAKKPPKRASAKRAPRAKPKAEAAETVTHSREAVSRAIEDAAAAAKKLKAPARANAKPPAASPDVEELTPVPHVAPKAAESSTAVDGPAVATRIRELEARLDKMIDQSSRAHDHPARVPPPPPSSTRMLPGDGEPTVFDTARELLSTDFYLRKWGRLGMRNRSEEVDDFGFDPVYEKKVQPVFDFLYDKYFRVEATGLEHIPSEGRCLLVANHSGTLPYDGVMIKVAVKRHHPAKRDVRWLAEDFIFHFPFLGSISNRIGAVRACQENAERLLRKDALVAVFPEGVKGIGKLFKERYQLQRFGRGGFIKLCLRTGTPIVPVAVIGAEEANPMLARVEYLSKAMGLPYIPVTPTFPLLGPLGLLPAPTKWKIAFGEKIDLDHGAESADDEILVGRLAENVRSTIQGMLDRGVGERRSIFFG
jgi:1-acyl-sn-glycerol-3-phosphate acyltransferase